MTLHGWEFSPAGRRVLFVDSVVRQLRLVAIEGFTALPHRGLEVGGLLVGWEHGGDLRIDAFLEVPCEHRYGPSYALSESDQEKLTELVAQQRPEPARVVGMFQSFTGREPTIEAAAENFIAEHFPCGDFLFLVLQPLSAENCLANFCLFRDGVAQGEFGDSAFAFESASLPVAEFDIRREAPTTPPTYTMSEEAADSHRAPTAGDVPIGEPVPVPAWRAAAPSGRTLVAPAVVGLAALVGAAGGYALKSSHATAPPTQARWAELRLDARPSGEKLLVTWDPAGVRSLENVRGTLRIADEGTNREIPLGGAQIAAGKYEYTPSHSDVAVRLMVTETSRTVATESVRLAIARELPMQSQVQSLSEKLDAIALQPDAIPPPAPRVAPRERGRRVRAVAIPRKAAQPADDPRWRQMQTKLADQREQIDTTREEASQARKELQANLNSTRDELGGSIAKTHEELAMLQKRGERNYYEFQMDKSKQFHAAGPLSLSLRKVNVKQGCYDLVLVVDGRQLEKKRVNLYEPLMFTLADRPQPVELVVNQINKNQVKGYVSEPKYKKSELADASTGTKPATNDPKALQRR